MAQPELEILGETKTSPISLALDEYEDLFSDFDPRPFSDRLLSDDFLYELKRASLDREETGLEVLLSLPREKRNPNQEKVIKERMKVHFRRHRKRLEDKRRRDRRQGWLMVSIGVVLMFVVTTILFYGPKAFWANFVVVLLEPAGWFTLWEGMELLVHRSREITPDLTFYRKMTGAKVQFAPIPGSPETASKSEPKS